MVTAPPLGTDVPTWDARTARMMRYFHEGRAPRPLDFQHADSGKRGCSNYGGRRRCCCLCRCSSAQLLASTAPSEASNVRSPCSQYYPKGTPARRRPRPRSPRISIMPGKLPPFASPLLAMAGPGASTPVVPAGKGHKNKMSSKHAVFGGFLAAAGSALAHSGTGLVKSVLDMAAGSSEIQMVLGGFVTVLLWEASSRAHTKCSSPRGGKKIRGL